MEYIYAGLLLHKAGKPINEANVKKVLEAAGVHVDEGRVKAMVAALDGVNIDQTIKDAAAVHVAAPSAAHTEAKKEEKKEEKPKEEATVGLGSLFG